MVMNAWAAADANLNLKQELSFMSASYYREEPVNKSRLYMELCVVKRLKHLLCSRYLNSCTLIQTSVSCTDIPSYLKLSKTHTHTLSPNGKMWLYVWDLEDYQMPSYDCCTGDTQRHQYVLLLKCLASNCFKPGSAFIGGVNKHLLKQRRGADDWQYREWHIL